MSYPSLHSILANIGQNVCNGIHRSLAANFRYALIWYVFPVFSSHPTATNLPYLDLQGKFDRSISLFYSIFASRENPVNLLRTPRRLAWHIKCKTKMLFQVSIAVRYAVHVSRLFDSFYQIMQKLSTAGRVGFRSSLCSYES